VPSNYVKINTKPAGVDDIDSVEMVTLLASNPLWVLTKLRYQQAGQQPTSQNLCDNARLQQFFSTQHCVTTVHNGQHQHSSITVSQPHASWKHLTELTTFTVQLPSSSESTMQKHTAEVTTVHYSTRQPESLPSMDRSIMEAPVTPICSLRHDSLGSHTKLHQHMRMNSRHLSSVLAIWAKTVH